MNARMTSLLYILMEPHKLALAIGYEPDVPISVTVVFVQLILELGLEMTVDVTAMWAESEHGIPMTEYFVHARSPFVGMAHFGCALGAMAWCCIIAFHPRSDRLSCASDDVCECLHLDQLARGTETSAKAQRWARTTPRTIRSSAQMCQNLTFWTKSTSSRS